MWLLDLKLPPNPVHSGCSSLGTNVARWVQRLAFWTSCQRRTDTRRCHGDDLLRSHCCSRNDGLCVSMDAEGVTGRAAPALLCQDRPGVWPLLLWGNSQGTFPIPSCWRYREPSAARLNTEPLACRACLGIPSISSGDPFQALPHG